MPFFVILGHFLFFVRTVTGQLIDQFTGKLAKPSDLSVETGFSSNKLGDQISTCF
jgi:hypothetical protein